MAGLGTKDGRQEDRQGVQHHFTSTDPLTVARLQKMAEADAALHER